MKFSVDNLVLAAALLLAGGKGAMAYDCSVMQCFEDHGGSLPTPQTLPYCYGDDMVFGYEGSDAVCRCYKNGCNVFQSRCSDRGWRVYTLGGCNCSGPSAC
ncbi:hypothetical protein F5144DRAFT_562376 [Chaetomium tenue]|uniref:Uncharacterized protein n=1 Tax=Chaetomium tenue TaxID=1854479 RepID=A0ACB7PHI3_9PEZI|nr:hypothetical protein F5144DRAFT_562376 [Chaetomium globosum]